ncbi:C-terminal helicase domain-containing protein [Aduncisulcus paluster]|uniref:C-terminal helicase domain-containing protein n=1 Tax=Aduncisulcus paluster TaxID=2918883 RepID=A0ABQ5KNX9_9EUKA|nr:C-terminal helicase domain-containing protein [Aduncisulcus paluster]
MAIVFCRTKRRVDALELALSQGGYNCEKLHGDLTQKKRERVMKAFRDLKYQFLIATDVAARGLDITGVTHIYNYDIPENAETYIHRIGRTGRAGDDGIAITFVAPRDEAQLKAIEQAIKMNLPVKYISLSHEDYLERLKNNPK